jgi:hypothetical protein
MLVRGLIASVVGMSAAAVSSPASRVLLDEVVSEAYSHSTAAFVTNEETKRAWVEAAVHTAGMGDDYRLESFRVKVPNLSYDARTREVVYENQGSRVVCARVTVSKFLFTTQTRVTSTGHCELLSRLEHRKDDNGFEYETNKHLVVELKVNPRP